MTDRIPTTAAEQYESLLLEASKYKGVSLWQDAWKRLRRNWLAMSSLVFLLIVAVLAVITPVLPLQSPKDKDLVNRQFLPPNFDAFRLGNRTELRFADNSLVAEMKVFNAAVAAKRKVIAAKQEKVAALAIDLKNAKASKLKKEALQPQAKQFKAELKELNANKRELQGMLTSGHPYEKLWHKPGILVKPLITLRLMIFGDWCVPSIAGTDLLGRDVLARVFWGARVSLIVGIVGTLVSLIVGVSWGATAGYFGGLVDTIMMRIVDVLYSVPFIFIVILLITFLSEPKTKSALESYGVNRIFVFYAVIGAIYWLTMARVVRGQVLSLKTEQFVDAARVVGAGSSRIIFRHLVPNVMGIVIVYLTLTIPSVMLFEAFLSFLGLGVEAPDVSWGLLANDAIGVITPIRIYWWLVLFPGLALTMTLFALNFLGDGLRDALDPRMKNKD